MSCSFAGEPGGQIDQPLGDQMHDLPFASATARNTEQARAEQFAALLLDQLRMNDDVGQAGFVFQRDEDDAGRRARPLPADDDAGGADQGAVACPSQLGRR
jgi:5-methylcytosine-specific restriction endonuclease McrBC GTP-binding regulatory subunit McrB